LENKKIYFASDQHFGAPTKELSKPREARFLQWLQHIENDCEVLFLLGDLFDFWFEYKTVVPKGYVRILGQLARMRDNGITIHFFVGNHDLWMQDYFTDELQIPVYHEPQIFELHGKKLFIGHGDGLGPGDYGYKRMKKVFVHPFSKWLYRWLHPDIGVKLAQYLSVKNKLISGDDDVKFLGKESEWLYLYAQRKYAQNPCDYFVFGHRHLPLEIPLNEQATYVNLGDWVHYFTYGVMENGILRLEKW
jgi:UDP-2,3-diacylglucosamine hydrolase